WDGVRAVAHKMKSSLQYMGLKETLELAKSIELAAREKVDVDQLPERINNVILTCKAALTSLSAELEKMQENEG
ncbi:MAG TPA: Hpt domain-containing protein, partial [Chitinophagales bacterium]|nr:Hpt domain-containing protein [Chitinophagales bacterium]